MAPLYEAVGVPWFTPIAERLVDELDPHSGEHVLDAGCGKGVALPRLSTAVGPGGRVTGIDISQGMLDKAAQTVSLRGLHNVELFRMDASRPDFAPMSFSVISSSLVLFFLPDPAAALRSWYQLLVPSGRIGLSTFGERDPELREIDTLFAPYLSGDFVDARTTGTRGAFASDEGVAGLLTDAGFVDVETTRWEHRFAFDNADHWYSWSMSTGQRGMWNQVPAANHDELQRRAALILERRRGADGRMWFTQPIRISIGFRTGLPEHDRGHPPGR